MPRSATTENVQAPIAWHVVNKNGVPVRWLHPTYTDPAQHADPSDSLCKADDCDLDGFPHRWEALYAHPPVVVSETARIHVTCGQMDESNGRSTWAVFLGRTADAKPWDCHQVYADEIEGRAQYEAAKLRHFLGQGPEPDILDFDTAQPVSDREQRRIDAAVDGDCA